MYSTPDFRKGLKIEINGEPFTMVDFLHVKPGKGGAFVRTTLKSLISGNVIERTFRSGEKVDKPDLEEKSENFQAIQLRNALIQTTPALARAGRVHQMQSTRDLRGADLISVVLSDLEALIP